MHGYSIFCFVHDTQDQVQDWVILIVIEIDMNNYTVLQFINNHFTETFFYIWNKQLINYRIDDKFSLL